MDEPLVACRSDARGVAAYDDAGTTMAANMMQPCALEGVQAFIDKRPPSWSQH